MPLCPLCGNVVGEGSVCPKHANPEIEETSTETETEKESEEEQPAHHSTRRGRR